MPKSPTLFGINLRKAIDRKRMNYSDAAHDIGISRSFLNMLMSGEKEPGPNTLASICSVLDISRADLYEEQLREQTVSELSPRELLDLMNKEFEKRQQKLLKDFIKSEANAASAGRPEMHEKVLTDLYAAEAKIKELKALINIPASIQSIVKTLSTFNENELAQARISIEGIRKGIDRDRAASLKKHHSSG